jgi:tetratricopeptide (TPR) repeat protein
MNKKLCVGMAFILIALLSCASRYNIYSDNLSHGKEMMRQGKFQEARMYFVKAAESQQLPEAYAFAATASYKMNDLQAAERYITEAEKHDGRGFSELRIAGYKALTYLKEGRKAEGMKALQDYTTLYSRLYPLINIEEITAMIREDRVDLVKLENLLDEQITRYENDIDQYQRTGTGFYDKGGRRGR